MRPISTVQIFSVQKLSAKILINVKQIFQAFLGKDPKILLPWLVIKSEKNLRKKMAKYIN